MKSAGTTETFAGLAILSLLAVIACGIYLMQFRYDPSLFVPAEPSGKTQVRASIPTTFAAAKPLFSAPAGLTALGPPESFTPETLSDKIDGKAELYLPSGFVGLECQRFATTGNEDRWFEVSVFEMGAPLNAFSVYSVQRRKDGTARPDIARFAYSAENALFFVHGQQYVEIIAASTDQPGDLTALAKSFIGKAAPASELPVEFSLFAPEGLDESSISLHMSDVFGFEGLSSIYTARYGARDAQLTAFLSHREAAGEAAALAESYAGFLTQNGGADLGPVPGIPGSRVIDIMDTYEVFFSYGTTFAGVHEAENRQAAEQLASLLFGRLSKETHETRPAGRSD